MPRVKGGENPNLPQAEAMKKQSYSTKSLSTFVSAASVFIDSCSQLTGSPWDGEKTNLESMNSSFQTRGTIKHWLIRGLTKSINAFLSYILLFHVPLTTYPIHLPIAVFSPSSHYSLLLTQTQVHSCGEKPSVLHIPFPVFSPTTVTRLFGHQDLQILSKKLFHRVPSFLHQVCVTYCE